MRWSWARVLFRRLLCIRMYLCKSTYVHTCKDQSDRHMASRRGPILDTYLRPVNTVHTYTQTSPRPPVRARPTSAHMYALHPALTKHHAIPTTATAEGQKLTPWVSSFATATRMRPEGDEEGKKNGEVARAHGDLSHPQFVTACHVFCWVRTRRRW